MMNNIIVIVINYKFTNSNWILVYIKFKKIIMTSFLSVNVALGIGLDCVHLLTSGIKKNKLVIFAH